MKQYCTVFDQNYLVRGLVLIDSLARVSGEPITVYVLNLSDSPIIIGGAIVFNWKDVADKDLLTARSNRTHQEFCWTTASWFMNWLFKTRENLPELVYLDADMMFFSDPEIIYREIGERSIGIIPHRFPARTKKILEVNGQYNVCWVYIKNNDVGRSCLARWSGQCIDWCYYRVEGGKLGDQKYLDEWAGLWGSELAVIENLGAGTAPWNAERYKISCRDNIVYIDDAPLVFYHYHGFVDEKNLHSIASYPLAPGQLELIYKPYVEQINRGNTARSNHEKTSA